jgi:hypothetical protein
VKINTSLSLRNLTDRHPTLPRHIELKLFSNVLKFEWKVVRIGPLRRNVMDWQHELVMVRERGGMFHVTLYFGSGKLRQGLMKVMGKGVRGTEIMAGRREREMVEWKCDPVGCSDGERGLTGC